MIIFKGIITIIYSVLAIRHNFKVLEYNKLLIGKNSFEVMIFDNGASWRYLTGSIIYVFVGVVSIYFIWSTRRYIDDESVLEFIIFCLEILFIIGLIIFTIYSINNPILQSELAVIVVLSIAGIAMQS